MGAAHIYRKLKKAMTFLQAHAKIGTGSERKAVFVLFGKGWYVKRKFEYGIYRVKIQRKRRKVRRKAF